MFERPAVSKLRVRSGSFLLEWREVKEENVKVEVMAVMM